MSSQSLNYLEKSVDNLLDPEVISNEKSASYCTDCQRELDNFIPEQIEEINPLSTQPNNFDNVFLENIEGRVGEEISQTLIQATRSLSKISLEQECQVGNAKCPSNNNFEEIYVIDTQMGADGIIIEFLENPKEHSKQVQDNNGGKLLCDKAVQTDSQLVENDLWDSEFPSETDLRKIDETIKNTTTKAEDPRQKIKTNVLDNKIISKNIKDITNPNCKSMTSVLLNRKKRLAHLSNDIYQLSSYLDDIRKALNAKESSPTISIPSPPAMTGYDCQFDFPGENRFGKLPITIESSKTSKPSNRSASSNSAGSSRAESGSSKATKRTSNSDEPASKRLMRRPIGKKTLQHDKENQNKKTNISEEISETTSMYAYNPLSVRFKKNHKLN